MIASQLLELFEGDSSQHLLVTLTGDQKDSGKRNAEYKTVYSAVTAELWQKHLNGEIIIGVKPELNDKAKWGCIDVDPSSYKDFKSKKFVNIIQEYKLPLVPVKSKSGGLHIFLFLKDWSTVKQIREVLDKWNSKFFMSKEVFPCNKSVGMPYHKSERAVEYAYSDNNEALLVGGFIEEAFKKRSSIDDLLKFKTDDYEPEEGYKEFPPCIQKLLNDKWTGDNRNNILFNAAVLEMKKSEGHIDKKALKEILLERNQQMFAEPLTEKEIVGTVLNSVFKNNYTYKCPPKHGYMTPICNKDLCRLRKLGIGAQAPDIIDEFSEVEQIKDMKTTYYTFKYKEIPMTFASIDLIDEKSFRTRMMDYGIFWMTLPKPKKGPPPFEMLMAALIANSKPSEKVKYEDTLADVRYSVLKEFFEKYMVLDDFEKLKDGYIVREEENGQDYCYFKKNTLDGFIKKLSGKIFSNSLEAITLLGCEKLDYYKGEKNIWKVALPDFTKKEKRTEPTVQSKQGNLTELDDAYHAQQFRTPK
jgi:hypothetical protein